MKSNNDLESKPIGQLLFQLSIPSIMGQLISLLYNIVDRIYLSHISDTGSQALAGVGITVPIIVATTSFASLIGMGAAPLISISMGEKKIEKAKQTQWICLVTSLFISIILTSLLLVFRRQILFLFGCNEELYKYAYDYYTICSLGTVFSIATLVINNLLTTQGLNKYNMIIVTSGALFNIIFDPLLIFTFNLGIKGAAIVTVFSQFGTTVAGLSILSSKFSSVKICTCKYDFAILKNILLLGFSSFFMRITESLINTVFNRQLIRYGSMEYVAILSIIYSIQQLIQLPIMGISQGSQPILSYNYGAKNKKRLIQTIKYSTEAALLICITGTILTEIWGKLFFRLFTDDIKIISLGIPVMKVYMIGRLFCGFQFSVQNVFRSLGDVKRPIIIAMSRKVILLVPLLYILPKIISPNVLGIFLAEPISDISAQILSLIIFIPYYRKYINTL